MKDLQMSSLKIFTVNISTTDEESYGDHRLPAVFIYQPPRAKFAYHYLALGGEVVQCSLNLNMCSAIMTVWSVSISKK